jgi:hypothetical protein
MKAFYPWTKEGVKNRERGRPARCSASKHQTSQRGAGETPALPDFFAPSWRASGGRTCWSFWTAWGRASRNEKVGNSGMPGLARGTPRGPPRGYALNAKTNPRSALESTKLAKTNPRTNLNEPERQMKRTAQVLQNQLRLSGWSGREPQTNLKRTRAWYRVYINATGSFKPFRQWWLQGDRLTLIRDRGCAPRGNQESPHRG